MKASVIIIALSLLLFSCEDNRGKQLERQADALEAISKNKYLSEGKYRSIEIVEIDSCEYVITQNAASGGITHKGNCKNKQHLK